MSPSRSSGWRARSESGARPSRCCTSRVDGERVAVVEAERVADADPLRGASAARMLGRARARAALCRITSGSCRCTRGRRRRCPSAAPGRRSRCRPDCWRCSTAVDAVRAQARASASPRIHDSGNALEPIVTPRPGGCRGEAAADGGGERRRCAGRRVTTPPPSGRAEALRADELGHERIRRAAQQIGERAALDDPARRASARSRRRRTPPRPCRG